MRRALTLGESVEARLPGVGTRTILRALAPAVPEALRDHVSHLSRFDNEGVHHLQARLESVPSDREWRAILRALGNPSTGGDFERALRDLAERIVEDAVEHVGKDGWARAPEG